MNLPTAADRAAIAAKRDEIARKTAEAEAEKRRAEEQAAKELFEKRVNAALAKIPDAVTYALQRGEKEAHVHIPDDDANRTIAYTVALRASAAVGGPNSEYTFVAETRHHSWEEHRTYPTSETYWVHRQYPGVAIRWKDKE